MSSFASVPGAGWAKSSFQMGPKTYRVDMSLHLENRKKVVDLLHARGISHGIALFAGGKDVERDDSDAEDLFQQNGWFNYLFGVKETNFYGAIDIETGKSILFMPKLDPSYAIWCGKIHEPQYFKDLYSVDEVLFETSLDSFVGESIAKGLNIHVLHGVSPDSGKSPLIPTFPGSEKYESNYVKTDLFHAVATARVCKSEKELELLAYTNIIASDAHVATMRTAKAGLMEYNLEATFLYEIYNKGGARHSAYTSICACGPNASILHYGHQNAPNDRQLLSTDIGLLDMGANYHGYKSDITCSYPIAGKFSDEQKILYNGVLNAQKAVFALVKPGVSWVDCHLAAEREILKALITVGVLHGDIEELVSAEVGAVFFPHGLGHLIGCDTHDAGGYLEGTPERSTRPGTKKLRTARVIEKGMVLTNEPGCYFIDVLIEDALKNESQSKYFNLDVLQRLRNFGGIRIEDDFYVTEDGPVNLTLCPRTVEEIESVMAGGQWPPQHDAAPELFRKWAKLSNDANSIVPIELPKL